MAKGYWISNIEVHDPENYKTYLKAATGAVQLHGGRFLIRGGRCEQVEGAARPRHVVIEFDSYEQALKAYRSPEYQAAAALRKPYSQSDLTIVEGP